MLEGTYEGRRVAVKVLRVHAKGLEAFRSVGIPWTRVSFRLEHNSSRGSVGRRLSGNTSNIKTFFHCWV